MMELQIVNRKNNKQPVIVGDITESLLSKLHQLEEEEKNTLEIESTKILSKCTSNEISESSTTGLIIGYVQSGKTLSFTTVTALAKDNGYRVVIILAGTKNNLLKQTTSRLKSDLTDRNSFRQFKILENPDSKDTLLIRRSLKQEIKPLILITLLKLGSRIDAVAKIFNDDQIKSVLGNSPVLIIDDEADQASLNTLERKNSKNNKDDESRTFSSIIGLRNKFINHTFLQYTATPQGPLLIDLMSVLSPDFHVILSPGLKYTGGKIFFQDQVEKLVISIPDKEVYHNKTNPLKSPPESLITALKDFYIGSAIQLDIVRSVSLLSMMIHPDVRNNASELFKGWIDEIIERWISNFDLHDSDVQKIEFLNSFHSQIKNAIKFLELSDIQYKTILDSIYNCLLDTKTHLVIGKNKEQIDWSLGTCHILIGGPKLDRGFTVKGLLTTYMPRHALYSSNADTIQQRCRFFGYKMPYLKSCRVYLPKKSIREYQSYVEHEEYLRAVLKEQTTQEFSRTFLLNSNLRPTRINILRSNLLKQTLSGSKQIDALSHIDSNTKLVKELISQYEPLMDNKWDFGTEDRKHRIAKITIDDAIQFLLNFKMKSVRDRDLKSLTIEYLIYHRDKKGIQDCNLIEMAYDKKGARRRALISEDRINNIFSGVSNAGSGKYPGDKAIKMDDSLNIQVHKIQLENTNIPHLNNRVVYTLGFIYPSNLKITLTGVN